MVQTLLLGTIALVVEKGQSLLEFAIQEHATVLIFRLAIGHNAIRLVELGNKPENFSAKD